MSKTPILGITELSQSQGKKYLTTNEALRILEQGCHSFRVLDKDLTAPPGGESDGDAYIVAVGAAGAWAGQDNNIAIYKAGIYLFATPRSGTRAYVIDEGEDYKFDGSAWELTRQTADYKDSVLCATTSAGALATSFENGDMVDGVMLSTGDRILIKDQAMASENGVYVVNASGAPTRATDFNENAEVTAGCIIPIEQGTTNGDKLAILTTNDPIAVGSTGLQFSTISGSNGELRSVQVFTTSGTWNRPVSVKRAKILVLGAGGGGGGSQTSSSSTTAAAGGGGGGGSHASKLLDVTNISSATITIGAGGSGGGGGSSPASGSPGGDSSWSDGTNTIIGKGGSGGGFSNAFVGPTASGGGAGGAAATGGDINAYGMSGFPGFIFGNGGVGVRGAGGNSILGAGGRSSGVAGSTAGDNGSGFGTGGSGGANGDNQAGANGGDGSDGIIIVWEYY